MAAHLTEAQIAALVAERKPLLEGYQQQLTLKPKRGHTERELGVLGDDGSEFRLILRQSQFNPLEFSAILAYRIPGSNQVFRLRRYNGKHQHTNRLERTSLYGLHIHVATHRYQESGLREDAYAEETNRYADLHGALQCLIADCGFDLPPGPQGTLF